MTDGTRSMTTEKSEMMTEKERQERNARIKGYICEALDDGILEEEDLAKIIRVCIDAGKRKYAELTEQELAARFGVGTHPGSEESGTGPKV